MPSFKNLVFTNSFINSLPSDPVLDVYSRFVEGAAFSFAEPTPTAAPKCIAISDDLAHAIGFETNVTTKSDEFSQVFTGNKVLTGMQPYAMCYGGHQFGHWAGQLGDGRAINLGQISLSQLNTKNTTSLEDENQTLTLQLKGAGRTPYSRNADGLAVLRSSIREFLCSEAMFHLGVPTTRALSLCLTGDLVKRDMFYDGNVKEELGAVVCRVSPSFIRFGSLQLPSKRKDTALLKQLVQYTIEHDFPSLYQTSLAENPKAPFTTTLYLNWFSEICDRTCNMIVHWMRVGFVHGVMNTDNMSIIGETIDYGPYGWVDDFNLQWTPNTTDSQGMRYCFGNQAKMAQWNLFQLANAIYPLVNDAATLEALLSQFSLNYQQQWEQMMADKLGLSTAKQANNLTNAPLFDQLENLLGSIETDMTIFYRLLSSIPFSELSCCSVLFQPEKTMLDEAHIDVLPEHDIKILLAHLHGCYYEPAAITPEYIEEFTAWFTLYFSAIHLDAQHYAANSTNENNQTISHYFDCRATQMNRVNPKFVLRNYITQQAITLAEQGDYAELHKLQKIFKRPYHEQNEFEQYADKRPDWAKNKAGCSMLSCSS